MPEQKGLVNIDGIVVNKETGKIQIPIIFELTPEEAKGLVNKLQELL